MKGCVYIPRPRVKVNSHTEAARTGAQGTYQEAYDYLSLYLPGRARFTCPCPHPPHLLPPLLGGRRRPPPRVPLLSARLHRRGKHHYLTREAGETGETEDSKESKEMGETGKTGKWGELGVTSEMVR